MATAVKVDDEAKSRLEELQAEIRLKTGENVTQQELLSLLIDEAYESRSEFIDSFRESSVPLSEDEKAAMQRGRFNSGAETDEEDIDDILYG
jgi:predicted transcriptional regulator